MSKTGAAKVHTNAGPIWCHFSESPNQIKLRRYSEGTVIEFTDERDAILDFIPLTECKKLVHAKDYSFKNESVWSEIFQALETGNKAALGGVERGSAKKPIIVPITELRRFYELIKILDVRARQSLAECFSEKPKSLERLWTKSRNDFVSYDNPDDWGKGGRATLPESPKALESVSSTNQFVSYMKRKPIDGLAYIGIREINPWRTRGASFSNSLPATKSGSGGMDVLLQNNETKLPVIGEIKVKNDKDAFYALVQAMTYAVEMSTPNQLKRLKKHFPQSFGSLKADSDKVEIALIKVNPPDDDPTRDPVIDLIKKINNSRRKWDGLGRIALLENCGEDWTIHK